MAENTKDKSAPKYIMDKAWEEVQKKTFTKWCNSHLLKVFGKEAGIAVLQDDFQTGVRLMQLVNALYGTPFPKYNKAPKMRPHKLDNIELALRMLAENNIKTNFLKPVHLADCDGTMILGMIWSIILDYQIKGISVEELTAKEGLLLWCQRKTHGYKDVKVENFSTSWQDGLAFCALIHKHRPDLLNFDNLSKNNPRDNLALAFEVAEKQLGIPRLLDVEDLVDVPRPDERSVMTYVSQYFHCFASQNQFEVAGRRIAKAVNLNRSNDQLKSDFLNKAQQLVDWINSNSVELQDRNYDNTLEGIEEKWNGFKGYKKHTKPGKTNEKLNVEETFNNLQAKLRVNNRAAYQPPEHLTLKAIDDLWNNMGREENTRSDWLRKELERQQRIENLASRFWRKASAFLVWGEDNKGHLSSTDFGNSVAAVQAKLKNHEGFEASLQSSQTRLNSAKQLGEELIRINYGKKQDVKEKIGELDRTWTSIRQLSENRRSGLQAELERQQYLENLRLEFATKGRALISWIDDAEDTLSEPVRVTSLDAINQLLEAFQVIANDAAQQEGDYKAIFQLDQTCQNEGITDNMYATYTFGQVSERWSRLQNGLAERQQALNDELQRQQDNEAYCRSFADKAAAFNSWCSHQREEISRAAHGGLEEQLSVLREKRGGVLHNKPALQELFEINQQIEERNITHNPFSEESVENLNLTFDKLQELINNQISLLEKEVLAQQGSKVSPEQLQEFQETFRNFDKNNSGSLQKLEFSACLSALGQNVTPEQLDVLFGQIARKQPGQILFEEFVDFMISRTEESESPATVKAAFKTIAGDRQTVSEEELRRVLDREVADYLISNMPRTAEGQFDYNAFADLTYNS